MSELAQKQVTPDTSKDMQKILFFVLNILWFWMKKFTSYLCFVKEKLVEVSHNKKCGQEHGNTVFKCPELGVVSGVTCFWYSVRQSGLILVLWIRQNRKFTWWAGVLRIRLEIWCHEKYRKLFCWGPPTDTVPLIPSLHQENEEKKKT